MLLARSDEQSYRFYSMSSQIRKERNSYYDILEKTQKGSLDITNWLEWFYLFPHTLIIKRRYINHFLIVVVVSNSYAVANC